MANYYFPRVNTSFYAMTRTPANPEESDATILFAPLSTTKGPENELTYVYSIAEFKEKFGDINFKKQGQQVLNVCRWLNAGGAVAVYRMNTGYESNDTNLATKINEDTKLGLQIGLDSSSDSGYAIYYTINDYMTNIKANDITLSYSSNEVAVTIGTDTTYTTGVSNRDAANSGTEVYDNVYEQVSALKIVDDGINLTIKETENGEEATTTVNIPAKISIPALTYCAGDSDANNDIEDHNQKLHYSLAGEDTFIPLPLIGKKAHASFQQHYGEGTGQKTNAINVTAKYSGEYYNDLKVIIKPVLSTFPSTGQTDTSRFSITVKKENTQLAYMSNVTQNTLYKFNNSQDYIIVETVHLESHYRSAYNLSLHGGTDCVLNDIAIVKSTKEALAKPLESRVDVMLDAGYSAEVKLLLLEFFCGTEEDVREPRNDVTLYLDSYYMHPESREEAPEYVADQLTFGNTIDGVEYDYFNANLCAQFGKIEDIYSETEDIEEIYVTPTYIYARLIPYNDATYGRQTPQAGLTYGAVTEYTWINEVPTDAAKNNYFADHINYIEKDSRGYSIMSQLSSTRANTNLDRINNGRVLNKIRNDIQDISRPYLYEILDATTIASLTNKLNAYMDSWKQNRTLSYYELEVEADATNNNQLNVSLWITFKYCIEVIDVSIVVM